MQTRLMKMDALYDDHLSLLLEEINNLKTWTKRKQDLKSQILMEIDRLKLKQIVLSKSKSQLSRFGQTKIIETSESPIDLSLIVRSKKVKMICLENEHCTYFRIALREA